MPDALFAGALMAHRRGDLDSAARDYRAALALSPDHPHALHYLGVVAFQRGRADEALPMLQRAISLVPHEPEFHNNLGLALAALDRNPEAAAAHRQALAYRPDHAGAWTNLGLALHAQNELPGAIDAFRRALAHAPDFTQARWNLSLALLHEGRFEEGWQAYDTRLSIPTFAPANVPVTAQWDGEDLRGRTILLVAEQGLGDAIQFIRLAGTVAKRGARVIVQAPRSLLALFRKVEGVSDVVASGDPPPAHDAWLPLLSLGRVLGIDASSIPAPVPYLRPDDKLLGPVAADMVPYAASLKVGIAWAGNRNNTNDRRRSIPLSLLAASLFDLEGVAWISLQRGDDEHESGGATRADRLVRLPWRNDFDGIAALMREVNVVVTVDTSIAHLAGALARPVFILLPFSSDWRWRTSRTDSDWYPTAKLFRQHAPGEWQRVLGSVKDAIRAFAGQRT